MITRLGLSLRYKLLVKSVTCFLHWKVETQKSAGVKSFAQIKKDLKPYMGQ